MLPFYKVIFQGNFGKKVGKSDERVLLKGGSGGIRGQIFVDFTQKPKRYVFLLPGDTVSKKIVTGGAYAGKSRNLRRKHRKIKGFVPGKDG